MSSLQLYPMLLNCGNALDDLKSLTAHDSLPPIFEHTYAGFEVVMSAAAYAQLKRHRMASIMARPYNPDFGFTYPVPVGDVNRGMKRIREMSEDLFNKTRSPYVLLNGHRRYLYLTMNMRSLYNFMQLRMDEHAQWDIRAFAENMRAALRAWPGINHYGNLAIELFAGRDKFVNNIERKA